MILIDLVYINSPGGVTLSKLLLDYIIDKVMSSNFEILVDKRNFKYFEGYKIKQNIISKTEFSRYFFYKKRNFKSVLCFANVPPPLSIKSKTFIYFHNEILLNPKNLNFSLIKEYLFNLKWIYIKSRNDNYTWLVQTEHIKILLKEKLKVNSILKYPIYNNQKKLFTSNKISSTFFYPTSNQPHKNNVRLINAFINASNKTNKQIILSLTIDEIKVDLPHNLKINFLGLIPLNKLIEKLEESEFMIFPSLKESFGLPLIEGVQANCKIIASNLNYVNELVKPTFTFNPYDEKSISEFILLALSSKKQPKSSIKVKNSMDLLINKLINV